MFVNAGVVRPCVRALCARECAHSHHGPQTWNKKFCAAEFCALIVSLRFVIKFAGLLNAVCIFMQVYRGQPRTGAPAPWIQGKAWVTDPRHPATGWKGVTIAESRDISANHALQYGPPGLWRLFRGTRRLSIFRDSIESDLSSECPPSDPPVVAAYPTKSRYALRSQARSG